MKALSIRQPWADAIIWHGKDVENRGWSTRYRGPVLIHAAKTWGADDRYAARFVVEEILGTTPDDKTPLLGGIIGKAEIVDCVEQMDSKWFSGPYGFVLRNAMPLPFRPCRGQLGFFTPDFSEPEPEPTGPLI